MPKTMSGKVWWGVLGGLSAVVCLLLFVSEFRIVSHRVEMQVFTTDCIPVSCTPSDKTLGKLIHVQCPLQHLDTLYAASEFSGNVGDVEGVFLETRIEMYQWVKKFGPLGPFYSGEFRGELVDSSDSTFLVWNQYQNPGFFPSVPGQGRRYSSRVYVGGYSIPASEFKLAFRSIRQLPLTDDGTYTPSDTRPPLFVDYSNTNVYDNALYTGDPVHPKVMMSQLTVMQGVSVF
eukprot:GHVQ01038384.1.p1 GENE.GHVQ01038384.1~~GHVQ01038384.1.p1  ORF type:complete len:232 (-),score=11.12 GHVQ01038384.1:94-789(-)